MLHFVFGICGERDDVDRERPDCSEEEEYAGSGGGRCEDGKRCFGHEHRDGVRRRRDSFRVSRSGVDEVRRGEFVGVDSLRGDVCKD